MIFEEFRKKFIRGFTIQKNVISALLYRELNISLSKTSIGVFGVILEPLVTIMIFVGLQFLIKGALGVNMGINPFIFFGIGILLFTIFSNTGLQAFSLIGQNKPLFFYRPVKPIDAAITRAVVNACLFVILLIIIFFVVGLFTDTLYINNFPLMVASITLLVIFSFAFQVILMVASYRFPPIAKTARFLRRPLFFSSGTFFASTALPQQFLKLALWNPLFHAIELTRSAASESYIIVNEISLPYLFESTFIVLFFAIVIYAKNQDLLLRS